MLAGFSMVFFDPGHIAKNLAYNPVITTGNLEFDHHEILLSVQREYINEAAADWKLYSGNAFVLIELKAGFEMCEILCQEIAKIALVGEFARSLHFGLFGKFFL